MDESTVKKAAYAAALLGIIGLYVVSETSVIPSLEGDGQAGRVRLSGMLVSLSQEETYARLSVRTADGRLRELVAFNAQLPQLVEGQDLDIIADLSEFRGKRELVAYRISHRQADRQDLREKD